MMVSSNCENCGLSHDRSYGSGRFCCSRCARAFSTKCKREEINQKVRKTMFGRTSPSRGKHNVPWITKICSCGNSFDMPPCKSMRKFCSRKCANQYADRSTAALKAFQRGTRKITGGTTRWLDYGKIKVQGTYEFRTCKILDEMKAVGSIKDWFYANDRINYVWDDGVEHTYLIDFTIKHNDDSLSFLEVKGFIHEHDERNGKQQGNWG